jgi:hypothetical protein
LEARFTPYQIRDAKWAARLPILVNRDYDFALGIGLGGYGVGIAASKRREANIRIVDQLTHVGSITPSDLARRFNALLSVQSLASQPVCPVRVYGFLFGASAARLRVVVEVGGRGPDGEPILYSAIGNPRAVAEFLDAAVLNKELDAGLAVVASYIQAPLNPTGLRGQCALGDSLVARGDIVYQDSERAVIESRGPAVTFISCRRSDEGVSEQNADGR